jgi:2'-5' RNA ligase
LRLFAALDLDDATRNRLASVARSLGDAPGVRWTKPEALHVTLRFFGEWPEERVSELTAALARIRPSGAPIEIALTRLAFLPNDRRPSVLVALSETPDALAELQRRIEETACALGFKPELRAFLPHVTLARIRDPRQGKKLVAAVRDYQTGLGAFTADRWTLYNSKLTPQGPVYTSVAHWIIELV